MTNCPLFKIRAQHRGRFFRLDSAEASAVYAAVLGVVMVFGMVLGAADSALAQTLEPVQVYATYGSADTGPNGPVSILDTAGSGEQGVFLWATGGTEGTSGPICTQAGSGDALCGISFTLSVTGGYQMVDFLPNQAFDHSEPPLPFRTMLAAPDRLVGNAFDLGVPTPENRYLGELRLRASGANGDSNIVVTGSAIGADLSMRNITAEAIVVPEPRAALMLGSGALGLLLCARGRRALRAAR